MKRLILTLLVLAAGLPAAAQGVRRTADEFNKMSRSDTTLVELKGVVSRMRGDQRGVFYLKDETGEAYIYGLVDGRPGSNVSFPQMKIAVGDTLTVYGRRTVYNGTTIEMAGGHLVRKADGPNHAAELEKQTALDVYPTFKGKGTAAFSAWVTSHLKYPKDAKAASIDGTVTVQFVVGKNGGVQEVQVLKGVHPVLDAEALRVVRSSPKWKPGIKDGKPVRVTYTLPVIFVLPD
ncbi:MAG: TonB family protein [Bacteroidales bacterium]|nr:TonB family protein [Bacteroidales bacterium]